MKKALFLLEFRRTALQFATLTAATLAVLFFVQVAVPPGGRRSDEDMRTAIDIVVLIVAAAAGVLVGVPIFCGDARRREIAFLEALPLDRAWIWALLVSSRIAASGVCFAVVVALRPWLLAGGPASLLLLGATGCHFLLLAAGCCFGSACRKLPFAFAATLLTTAFVVFETVVGIPKATPDLAMTTFRVSVISTAFFGLSAWFVHRSELDLFRSRVRNLSTIAAASATLVFAMQQPPPRQVVNPEEFFCASGSVYASAEPLRGGKLRVATFDTRTGRCFGSVVVPDVRRAEFSEDGERLWLVGSTYWPLRILDLALPRGEGVLALRRDGILLGPYPLEAGQIGAFQPIDRGRALVVSIENSQGRLIELDATGRGVRERMVAPVGPFVNIRGAGDRHLVTFVTRQQPWRTWLVNGEVNELKVPPGEFDWFDAPLLDGTLYPSQRVAAAALAQRLGVPAGELLLPGFRDAKRGWILRTVGGDARRCERIDVLPPDATRWKPPSSSSADPARCSDLLDADLNFGVLVFDERTEGRIRFFVRDLATNRGLEIVEDLPKRPSATTAKVRAASGGDRYVVTIDRLHKESDSRVLFSRSIVVGNRASGSLATLTTLSEPAGDHRSYWTDLEGNTVVHDGEKRIDRLHLAAGGVIDLVP